MSNTNLGGILDSINKAVKVHEPNVVIHLKSVQDTGLHLEVSFTNIEKIVGLNEIKKIINKHLLNSDIKCLSLKLKR
jgi:hypothetical protein